MSETRFTKGEWKIYISPVYLNKGYISVESGEERIFGCEMYNSDHVEKIANANLIATAPEMYQALEETNKELEWAINEINRLYAANHNPQSLDEPDRLDMETCHNNNVLLAQARGEHVNT